MRAMRLVSALWVLSGCATNPENAARISYRLPRTDAAVTLAYDVKQCVKPDSKDDEVILDATLRIDASAGKREKIFYVAARDLVSGTTQRELTIGIDENGVIQAVNSTATDQKAAVLANVAKIAGTVIGMVVAKTSKRTPTDDELRCTDETKQALGSIAVLKQRIGHFAGGLATSAYPAADRRAINALAAQIAQIQGRLHRDSTGECKLEPKGMVKCGQGGTPELEFDWTMLGELFHTGDQKPPAPDAVKKAFGVTASFGPPPDIVNGVQFLSADQQPKYLADCKIWVSLPAQQPVNVEAKGTGSLLKEKKEDSEVSLSVTQEMQASQLTDDAKLCVSTNFGENYAAGLAFDKFGRATQLTWKADAWLAGATGGVAGAAPDVSGVITSIRGRGNAADQAELDRLTLQQNLRKARECQKKMDAGATSCEE